MKDIQTFMHQAIAYYGGSKVALDLPQESWCVVIELHNPAYSEIIAEHFGANFKTPMLANNSFLVGVVGEKSEADWISNHIRSIASHFNDHLLKLPFKDQWLSHYLTHKDMGIRKQSVSLISQPVNGDFGQYVNSLVSRDSKIQKAYDSLCATTSGKIVKEWTAHLTSHYEVFGALPLADIKALDSQLSGLADEIKTSASVTKKMFASQVDYKFRALIDKVKAQDVSASTVNSADSESRKYHSIFSHEKTYGLRLELMQESSRLATNLIDDMDPILAKGVPDYYLRKDFMDRTPTFDLGPDTAKNLRYLVQSDRLVPINESLYKVKTLAHQLVQLFATHVYASEIAKRTQAFSKHLDGFSNSMDESTSLTGLTAPLKWSTEKLRLIA